MANPRRAKKKKTTDDGLLDAKQEKGIRRQLNNISNLIGQANLSLFGTDRTSEVDDLNTKFYSLLNDQINTFTNHDNEDITSFLSQVVSDDNKSKAVDDLFNNTFEENIARQIIIFGL